MSEGFGDVVGSMAELRSLYRPPHELAVRKKRPVLDPSARAFIESSPFVLLATADAAGRCDVSPRGGPRGFVKVIDDERLALPDLNGNNLLDSLSNVVANPFVGLLFLVPGRDETLRVDGRACVTTDPVILDLFVAELRRPVCAVGVQIETVFLHCAKAFRRGRVWDASSWSTPGLLSATELWACQLDMAPISESDMEAGYAADLAADLTADTPSGQGTTS